MILRDRFRNPQSVINAGMLCFVLGLLMVRFVHPPTDFWRGFVAGFAGGLIGISTVLNLRGLYLARQQLAGGE